MGWHGLAWLGLDWDWDESCLVSLPLAYLFFSPFFATLFISFSLFLPIAPSSAFVFSCLATLLVIIANYLFWLLVGPSTRSGIVCVVSCRLCGAATVAAAAVSQLRQITAFVSCGYFPFLIFTMEETPGWGWGWGWGGDFSASSPLVWLMKVLVLSNYGPRPIPDANTEARHL